MDPDGNVWIGGNSAQPESDDMLLKFTAAGELLLQIGNILEQGWDQIFNLYNDVVVSVSDVFETLVYRSGIQGAKYSYATAINLFQNVVGFALLIAANQIVRRYNEYSIW